jgi:tetratricopeptide (TPR) repeat protein
MPVSKIMNFEEVIAIDPKNAFAYNNLASIALKNRDYKKARDLASRSIELDPKNGPAYYNRGIARQLLREEDGCCADWKKALELGVSGAKAFINATCSN